MKYLILIVLIFFVSCSNPSSAEQKADEIFTICVVNVAQSVSIYYATWNNGFLYPGEKLCTVEKGKCVEVTVPDGQLLMYVLNNERYGVIAHGGEYWNL
jgi:hypothetical protein